MSHEQDVTLGEVHRIVIEIRADVRQQNSRVSALEKANERLKVYGFIVLLAVGVMVEWLKKKVGL